MDRFLQQDDELGKIINEKATELYGRITRIDAASLGMPAHCLHYFMSSHTKRLFFSIETSAHLLYRSIVASGKAASDIIIMDYGAGVGTLYLLARMIGCHKVIYNDHLEDWRQSAQLVAEAVGVQIDQYIVGDIDDCLDRLALLGFDCDIIASRNVIEHIYRLDLFYAAIHEKQQQAIVFSSTTANKQNPASVIKHMMWHRKWEKVYHGMRRVLIERQAPGLSVTKVNGLARATRGLAAADLKEAIEEYRRTGRKPGPSGYGSNTCDPSNGVWAEHLLDITAYRTLINEDHYQVSFQPGFWDTHYTKPYKNFVGRLFNKIISRGGKKAMTFAPFIYVIARPLRK